MRESFVNVRVQVARFITVRPNVLCALLAWVAKVLWRRRQRTLPELSELLFHLVDPRKLSAMARRRRERLKVFHFISIIMIYYY